MVCSWSDLFEQKGGFDDGADSLGFLGIPLASVSLYTREEATERLTDTDTLPY